ncbi:MAG: DinB family protein [Acidobacteria bacterium]|nr:DinB family protein [Acidobacteriota bacterium]
MIRIDTVLDSWKTVRQDTIQAVEDFPAGEMGFRPTPDTMTFGEIARHILEAGHALTGLMLDGVENLNTPEFRGMLRKYSPPLPEQPSPAQLAGELRGALDLRLGQLAAQPPDFFSHPMTRMDGQKITRLEMLQFVKEHELTHRAQLFLYLRLKGIVPATTRRRLAKQADAASAQGSKSA